MNEVRRLLLAMGCGFTALSSSTDALAQAGSAEPVPATSARAVRGPKTGAKLDGILDDQIWQSAPRFGGFTQRDPDEGRPATEATEFQVVYTDQAIYVAVRAHDQSPDRITAALARRDAWVPSDEITIMIDSYRDRRTGFSFSINAAGVKRDAFLFDDNNQDDRWDAVWDAGVRIDSTGWVAEFRIPFSQLRFSAAAEQVFGFNVSRRINRLNETQYWRLPPKNAPGFVSRFGDLEGLSGITPPRRLEVLPYAATSGQWQPATVGSPFQTGSRSHATAGGDLKVGINSALTLTATINPDFGQVEADPAVVNLSAFESFFAERRPFFTEGFDVFRFRLSDGDGDGANEELFYTRRIGRRPQGSANPRGGFAESVDRTTILGAGKLSGKTRNGWTVGVLTAVTAEESARVLDAAGGWHQDVVEPRTGYGVARVAREFRNGQTVIGLLGTTVQRSLPDQLGFLHSDAYTGGVSWQHRFRRDGYHFSGRVVGSRVSGSPEAILATQRSSARYYQRPDADYLEVDSSRTSLSGYAFGINGGKTSGNWRWNVGFEGRSPGFEVNDLGFQREADRVGQNIWVNRRWLTPGPVFRRFNLNFNQWSGWTYGGERRFLGGNINANYTLRNYRSGWFGINRSLSGVSPTALRGGPSVDRPGNINGWFGMETDNRKTVRGGFSLSGYADDDSDNFGAWTGVWISWRPAPNVDLTFNPELNWNRDEWQYLATESIAGRPEYLMGSLRQRTAAMTLRSNVAFTPNLTLQLYAQPFVSTGRYDGFRRVVAPRAGRFQDQFDRLDGNRATRDPAGNVRIDVAGDGQTDVTLDNPDFRVLSFRSNLVLRWEYQAGSTIFLVWQHGRSGFTTDGGARLGESVGDLFRSPSSNVLLIKASYWLGL
ncbi:MAG: DUF5916 domain-containing protein [Gemmatimonadales bacterium]|nr:DUF5916 domain-containing protein [Gemmatimonadales bacterium]